MLWGYLSLVDPFALAEVVTRRQNRQSGDSNDLVECLVGSTVVTS